MINDDLVKDIADPLHSVPRGSAITKQFGAQIKSEDFKSTKDEKEILNSISKLIETVRLNKKIGRASCRERVYVLV